MNNPSYDNPFQKPVKASLREILSLTISSFPFLWNKWCSFSMITITTSPGSTPGFSSAYPRNGIFVPSVIPGSIWTSRTFRSLQTFFPWHVPQRYFAGTNFPSPSQCEHFFGYKISADSLAPSLNPNWQIFGTWARTDGWVFRNRSSTWPENCDDWVTIRKTEIL